MNPTFEIYPDKAKKYRWRLRASNGQIVACSGESFASKGNARRAVERFRMSYYGCDIVEIPR